MENSTEFTNLVENLIDNVDDIQWLEFMRRLGCKCKKGNLCESQEKRLMLHKWKVEMDKIQSQATSCNVLKVMKKEIFGRDQDLDTTKWPEHMKKERAIALLFYGVMKIYYEKDMWHTMVVMKLRLEQYEIMRCRDSCPNNFHEEKYKILQCWKTKNNLDSVDDVKRALADAEIMNEAQIQKSSVARFRQVLNSQAEEQTNIDLPVDVDKAINAVTLQILKKPGTNFEHLDSTGQYNKQKEMSTILESPKGDITIKKLFALAEKNAEDSSIHRSDAAQALYRLKQGNNILVTGQAGIGKTTLTKMVLKLILEKELLPDTKYLIFIKLRKIDFDIKTNIVDFLITFAGFEDYLSDMDPLTYDDFKSLNKSPHVSIIFDGIDEANTSTMNEDPPLWNPKTSTCPSIIIRNIMQGNIFSKAKKMWTSRQRQAYELHEKVRPHTIVQILGLDQNAQNDLGEQLCTEEGWPKVKKYLEDHPDLQAICYVPVICIIAVTSIHASIVLKEDDVELHTMTDVLAYALDIYSRLDHLRGRQQEISKIPKLAWDAFVQDKIIFSEKDFRSADIDAKSFEAFLVTVVDKNTNFRMKLVEGDKKSSFSHLIWHEMFTAIKGMMFMKDSDLEKFLKYLVDAKWEVVAKLMFGLCHSPTLKRLKRILYDWLDEETDSNVQLLKDFAVSQMKVFHSLDGKNVEEKTQKLIQICTWVKETNSSSFLDIIQPLLPEVVNLSGEIIPSDIRCIAHVLPEGHSLSVGVDANVRFIANSLPLLCSEILLKSFKVTFFNLEGNNLNNFPPESFSKCLKNVDNLNVLKCRVSDAFLAAICKAIKNRALPMESLDLSHNPISINGVQSLAECLHNVVSLNIDTCKFDSVHFEIIARYLLKTNHRISLHIGYTNITNRAANALCSCLQNISSMAYARCGVLDKGFMQFTETIQRLPQPMDEIILSTNISAKNDLSKMTDEAKAFEVSQCLNKVKRLKLNCWIKKEGAKMLATAIQDLKEPMELLDVSGNKFGDEGADMFLSCLNNISKLVLANCKITREGFLKIAEFYKDMESKKPIIEFGSIEGVAEAVLKP